MDAIRHLVESAKTLEPADIDDLIAELQHLLPADHPYSLADKPVPSDPALDPELRGLNLEQLLGEVVVGDVDDDMVEVNRMTGKPIDGLEGWYFVSTPTFGPVAYFQLEDLALRYRLDVINRVLNG